MRLRTSIVLALACAPAAACSKPTNPAPPAVLNRSGDIQLVCYDRAASGDDTLVLPLGCCAGEEPLSESPADCPVPTNDPVLHGLVSQTGRGELAALNLDDDEVVDSDRRVPGYTFVDVGGLPRAMVVPKTAHGTDGTAGPAWVFVAGAETSSVQAVATCRFYRGTRCGPEAELSDGELAAASRVVLPAEPSDMVLSQDGAALWVSMPDAGLVARVALSDDPARPFALDELGAARAPTFFRVPGSSVSRAADDAATAADPGSYEIICGLGYTPSAGTLTAPDAPTVELDAGRAAEPARLVIDELTGLLYVADRASPVLRAFDVSGEGLERVGEWDVGRPLRDFALTAEVPARAPSLERLITAGELDDTSGDLVRYLYAIDDQGLVQAFSLAGDAGDAGDAGAPTLTRFTPPNPSTRYGDRLQVLGNAVALTVIDTRAREPYVCGTDTSADEGAVDALERAIAAAKKRGDAAEVAALEAELAPVELKRTINESAAPNVLRGVFVAITSSAGAVNYLDVLDLDAACRTSGVCSLDAPDDAPLQDGPIDEGMALRRHAQRLSGLGEGEVTVDFGSNFVSTLEECPEGYVRGYPTSGSSTSVCIASNPWLASNRSWTITYEEAIPNFASSSGMLELDDEGALWVRVPAGFDLCRRGIENEDAIHIVSNPADGAPRECPRPATSGALRLRVLESYVDRARVELVDEDIAPETLVGCYPELHSFEVHTLGRYLVLGEGTYLSHKTSDESGLCIDDERDARLVSRLDLGVPFVNPFIAFTLEKPEATSEEAVAVTISVRSQGAGEFSTLVDANATGRTDVLPVRARYFRESADLYFVDSASQGLRRFALTPLTPRATFR